MFDMVRHISILSFEGWTSLSLGLLLSLRVGCLREQLWLSLICLSLAQVVQVSKQMKIRLIGNYMLEVKKHSILGVFSRRWLVVLFDGLTAHKVALGRIIQSQRRCCMLCRVIRKPSMCESQMHKGVGFSFVFVWYDTQGKRKTNEPCGLVVYSAQNETRRKKNRVVYIY